MFVIPSLFCRSDGNDNNDNIDDNNDNAGDNESSPCL